MNIDDVKRAIWPDWLCDQFKGWMCSQSQSDSIKHEIAVFLENTRAFDPERFDATFPKPRDWTAQVEDGTSPFEAPENSSCIDKQERPS